VAEARREACDRQDEHLAGLAIERIVGDRDAESAVEQLGWELLGEETG